MAWTHKTETDQTQQTDKTDELEPPTNAETLKNFPGAIEYFATFIPNLSETTDNMRRLLTTGNRQKTATRISTQ